MWFRLIFSRENRSFHRNSKLCEIWHQFTRGHISFSTPSFPMGLEMLLQWLFSVESQLDFSIQNGWKHLMDHTHRIIELVNHEVSRKKNLPKKRTSPGSRGFKPLTSWASRNFHALIAPCCCWCRNLPRWTSIWEFHFSRTWKKTPG